MNGYTHQNYMVRQNKKKEKEKRKTNEGKTLKKKNKNKIFDVIKIVLFF